MRICILTPRFPFPENGGDVLRINNIARYLKRRGHTLILLSLLEDPAMVKNNDNDIYDKVITVHHGKFRGLLGSLRALLFSRNPLQCGYYHSRIFKNVLHRVVLDDNPDLFISHLIRMAPYLIEESLIENSIIEMTDALSVTYSLSDKAKGISVKKMVYKIEKGRIEKYEQLVIGTFRKTVLVSQKDVDYFNRNNLRSGKLYCYKNGVELTEYPRHTFDSDKICFVGNMRTLQNQDAVLFYVKNVFPALLKERPNTKLYIVGAQPSATIQKLASDHIVVTGYVDSIYDVICDACYAIAPIQIAAGIQNKVLFSMAYHIPVIMTSLIAKAIPETKHENNCIIADCAEDYFRWGKVLSEDCDYRNRIADAGYQMVQHHYSWDSCLSGYEIISDNF